MLQKQGELDAYNREQAKQETLLGMAAERKAAATAARQANTQMWMGLAGGALGAVGGALSGGLFGGKD